MAVPEASAEACLKELKARIPEAAIVGYVEPMGEWSIVLE